VCKLEGVVTAVSSSRIEDTELGVVDAVLCITEVMLLLLLLLIVVTVRRRRAGGIMTLILGMSLPTGRRFNL